MHHLVFCDLDGTLIKRHTYIVDQYNINKISDFVKKDNIFVISTGRFIERIQPVLDQINKNYPNVKYVIGLVGAHIYDVVNHKDILCQPIDPVIFKQLFDFANSHKISFLVNCQETFDIRKPYGLNVHPKWIFNHMSKGLAFKVGDKNTKITNPLKLIFPFVRIRYGRKLYKELVRRFGEQLHIVKQNHYIEVVSKRADKGTAIKFLVKYLHYDNPNLYNTISIGDSENDIEMFNETNRKYVVAPKISKSPLLTYDYPIIGNADYNAVGKILQSLMDEDAHDEQLSNLTKVIAPISAAKKETEPKEISPVSKHQVLVKKES